MKLIKKSLESSSTSKTDNPTTSTTSTTSIIPFLPFLPFPIVVFKTVSKSVSASPKHLPKFKITLTGHSGFKAVNDEYAIITSAQKIEIERWDSITGETEIDKISAEKILMFLAIWLASKNGNGLRYYDGDEKYSGRVAWYRDTRAREKTDKLPWRGLFIHSSNMGTEIAEETIMRVLCGSDSNKNREVRKKEVNIIRAFDENGNLKTDTLKNDKDTIYKVERINPDSIFIGIENNVRKLLGKIKIEETNFDSDKFKKILIKAVNSQTSA